MAKVYRVEHIETGVGPYTYRSHLRRGLREKMGKYWNTEKYPGWREDFHEYKAGYWSGFTSIKQLKWWFYGVLTDLKNSGFVIKEYTVPKENIVLSKSGKQLVFKK